MAMTPQLFEEVGRLCAAWAYLEMRTEQTIWGVIGVDQQHGRFITWRLDMRGRWELLLQQAPNKHGEKDVATLRGINKGVVAANRDRNIIVHGSLHSAILSKEKPLPGSRIEDLTVLQARPHCWTVYRGADAAKNFPASKEAVEIVRTNVQKLARRLTDFNNAQGYVAFNTPMQAVEQNWPTPLE